MNTLRSRPRALSLAAFILAIPLAASPVLLSDTPGVTMDVLTSLARVLVDRGAVPVSNPIGVPRP